MAGFEGLVPSGRRVRGPITDLVELEAIELQRGSRRLTAIRFAEDWRGDPALGTGLDPIRAFLQLPMVEGLSALEAGAPGSGVFVNTTSATRSVRELIGIFAEEAVEAPVQRTSSSRGRAGC